MFAAHHRLANLVAIVDLNGQQALGYTENVLSLTPMAERWRAFGWDVHEVDGHDVAGMQAAIDGPRHARRARRTCWSRARCSARASPSWSARSSGTTGRCPTTSTGRRSRTSSARAVRMRKAFVAHPRSSWPRRDPRILLLTGDLGYMALEPFAERFPDRFFNVGVAEQNMVGLATGLAEAGFVPFVYSIVDLRVAAPVRVHPQRSRAAPAAGAHRRRRRRLRVRPAGPHAPRARGRRRDARASRA